MKVAVIGAAHSRNVFNAKFVKNYKKYFQLDTFYTLTSMLSLMSRPIEYNYQNLITSGLKNSEMEHFYFEFEKTMLKTLESNQPDVLVLDFHADARYGARAYDAEYLTDKLYAIKKKDVIDWKSLGIVYSYKENTNDFIMMWQNSFDRFMAFVREKMPNTVVVVNTVKGTNEVTDALGNSYISEKIKDLDINRINALWRYFDDYAIKKYKLKALRFEKEYTLDADYVYGLGNGMVHFHKEYFEDCFEKLVELTAGIQVDGKTTSNVNLIIGSDFKQIEQNWMHCVGDIEKVVFEGYDIVKVGTYPVPRSKQKFQMWSKAIEVQGNGKMAYTLSFYIKVPDVEVLNEDSYLFGIRTFEQMHQVKYGDCIKGYPLKFKGHDIKSNEEYRYEYTFKPKGKYVKVALLMTDYIPGVEYSRIKLERAESASDYTK